MSHPWKGSARRLDSGAIDRAAARYNLEPAIIRAIWDVESSGKPFRADGTLERRYEPHKMPGSGIDDWKVSLKLSTTRREAMFYDAFERDANAAMRATSWGGPQIMGFNAESAGFVSAAAMVTAMAADEAAQLQAFMTLIDGWGLITVLRAHDWRRFAARYNGDGQAAAYAVKIETAYRRHSNGRASPVVLRLGRAGDPAAVRELQSALGVKIDGQFGRETDRAVRAFQERYGLKVDGIVGAETWAMLRDRRDAKPTVQATQGDVVAKVTAYSGAATAAAGAIATVGDSLPDTAMNILVGGATLAGLLAVVAFLFARLRRGKALI